MSDILPEEELNRLEGLASECMKPHGYLTAEAFTSAAAPPVILSLLSTIRSERERADKAEAALKQEQDDNAELLTIAHLSGAADAHDAIRAEKARAEAAEALLAEAARALEPFDGAFTALTYGRVEPVPDEQWGPSVRFGAFRSASAVLDKIKGGRD